jgi:GNAT superfamily N-acetyltransferase
MAASLANRPQPESLDKLRTLAEPLPARVKARIRYYRANVPPSGLVLQILIDVLAKMGVLLQPYHLVAEGMKNAGPRPLAGELAEYEIGFLGPGDMPALAAIPGRTLSLEALLSRLRDGELCIGARYHGEIVAFMWCNLTECEMRSRRLFALQEHEAYLFDAYTLEHFRGKGLAPHLRSRCYEELAKLGRDQCYSITAVWNPPAAKFKKKLGARVLALGVLVTLFRRWRFHVPLRSWRRG